MEEISHTWSILELIQKNNSNKIVKEVKYEVTSTSGDLKISLNGSVELSEPEDFENFILYENLTEEKVLSWVFDALGPSRNNYEISNFMWINEKRSIPYKDVIEKLPWN